MRFVGQSWNVGRFGQRLSVEEQRDYITPCWVWTGCVNPAGYGNVRRGGKTMLAHRWSYEMHVGPIGEGCDIDHLCRVPACIRPDHLESVMPEENHRRGARRTLTLETAAEIRARAATMPGTPWHKARALTPEYPVGHLAIWRIITGEAWVDPNPRTRRAA